ncbi:monooxygenase 2-like [Primulina huaijiensis]|uniref:monooxygenase 2-like n=1 Tax=Primulina huaijiensis TaxID=1492673 RepID=UPI003CC6FAB8
MKEIDIAIYEDIVIVGAGISGLTTALGLHRLGVRSLVLESSESLKFTGFALTTWPNAWRALDAVGVGDLLRKNSIQTEGFKVVSSGSIPLGTEQSHLLGDLLRFNFESRCIKRKDLLETLESELPRGTIRYSSEVVSIEETGNFKLVHLADGSVVKTKVLIGCDGGNSMVAKWLGIEGPVSTGRSAIRGLANYPDGHGFEPKFHVYSTWCVHCGFVPCDEKSLYWFCNFSPSFHQYNEENQDPLSMIKFVASQLRDAPLNISNIVERTELDCICCTPLRLKLPWNFLLGNSIKNNVCVVGDAFHPMTPAIGQGGGSSLEDSVVLARCLGKALTTSSVEEEYIRVEKGLKMYVKERRWRILCLLTAAYIVGFVQSSGSKVISFLRKRFLTKNLVKIMARMGDFDCGDLTIP